MLGDRFEAEDLALETFWRFYEAPPNQAVNIGGWLYRVATNLGLNSLRMNRRRKENERQAAREYLESPRSANPADQVERRLERLAVQNILAQMKTRDAHLLILRHSGLSYKELAKILEVAPSSIGTLLARAEAEFERRYRKLERGE
jgi:RNA polymerase sigma-70 factor (ECF subfamily)